MNKSAPHKSGPLWSVGVALSLAFLLSGCSDTTSADPADNPDTGSAADASNSTARDAVTATDTPSDTNRDPTVDVSPDTAMPSDTSAPDTSTPDTSASDVLGMDTRSEDLPTDTLPDDVACLPPSEELPNLQITRQGRYAFVPNFPASAVGLSDRGIAIYLPADYETNTTRQYRVLYMHDAQNLFDARSAAFGVEWEVDETIDALVDAGTIEPYIVVGIDNTANRIDDYTPDADPDYGGGQGERYAQWIAEHLKPWVDATLRTRCGPANTALAGSSLGGLISFFIGQRYPALFGRIGSLSPSFWWNNAALLDQFDGENAVLPYKLWVDAGTSEGGNMFNTNATPSGWEDLSSTTFLGRRATARALALGAQYGADVGYLEVLGGQHNEAAWAQRLYAAFGFLLSDAPKTNPTFITPYLYRPNMVVGSSTVTALEASFEDGVRLTWPAQNATWSFSPPSTLRVGDDGLLEAIAAGETQASVTIGAQTATVPLQTFDPTTHASVRFVVQTPQGTSGWVHLTGSAPTLGDWLADSVALNPDAGGQWSRRIPLPRDADFEYKYTLGSWETVEKGAQGEEVGNRQNRSQNGLVIEDFVENWAR